MTKSFQSLVAEIGSKKLRPFYIFANCPRILLEELVCVIKENLGKSTQVQFISSPKDSIVQFLFNTDFIFRKKILVFDIETVFPSQSQVLEVVSSAQKLVKKDKFDSVLILRTETKPLPRIIQDNFKDHLCWISYEPQNILSLVKSKFQGTKFMQDADDELISLVKLSVDIEKIVNKAVLFAYPRTYIWKSDILAVTSYENPKKIRSVALSLIMGDSSVLKYLGDDNLESLMQFLILYFIAIVKMKLESEVNKTITKYQIYQTFKVSDVEPILKEIRTINLSKFISNFNSFLSKSRRGVFLPSVYIYEFVNSLKINNK